MDPVTTEDTASVSLTPADESRTGPSLEGRELITREFIRRHNVGIAWILVAVLGIGAIMMFRSAGGARLVMPCGLMAGYLFYSLSQRSQNLERIGDSVYFLGFIWTLFALTDALIFRRASDVGVQEVFAIFGYALVTTGVGMFLRMSVLQFRYSIPDQLEDERAELAKQVAEFQREVLMTGEAISSFRRLALTNSQDWIQDWRRQNELVLRGMVDDSSNAIKEVQSAVADVTKEIKGVAVSARETSSAMTAVTRTTTSITRRLSENEDKWLAAVETGIGQLSASISGWVAGIEHAELPSDEFKKRITDVLDPLDKSCHQLTITLKNAAGGSDMLRQEAQNVAPALKEMSSRLSGATAALREFDETMAQSRQTAHSFWDWWRSR